MLRAGFAVQRCGFRHPHPLALAQGGDVISDSAFTARVCCSA